MDKLQADVPGATRAECQRFEAAFGTHAATSKLRHYMAWRQQHDMDPWTSSAEEHENDNDDASDWNRAVDKALAEKMIEKRHEEPSSSRWLSRRKNRNEASCSSAATATNELTTPEQATATSSVTDSIPQLLFCPSDNNDKALTDARGNAILYCLPAQMDLSKHSADTYLLVMAFYLHLKFDRNNTQQYTLLLDVRAGRRWPNPPAHSLIGVIRSASRQLQDLVPHRLYQCLVLNVPGAAVYVFDKLVRPLLAVSSSLHLLAGGANVESDTTRHLPDYLATRQEGVDWLDQILRRAFW